MGSNVEKMTKFLAETNKHYKKKFGADVLYFGNEVGNFKPFQTGFPTIDWINSGIGGFPRGGMTLIHGLESTGKSTLVIEAIRYQQSIDPESTCLYIDVENALSEAFFEAKGIDTKRLTLSPLNTESALNIAEDAIKQDVYDIIVIDSFAKLESEKILEKEIGEAAQRNRRAKIITEFLCRITFTLRKSNTALVCINQEVMNQDPSPYAPKTVLPCGMQQKFSANLRLQLRRSKAIKSGDGVKVGYLVSVTSAKNKIAARENAMSYMTYLYDRGFIREMALVEYLEAIGQIRKLPQKRYEFCDKSMWGEPFKVSEMSNIAKHIKEDIGVDLYQLEPGSKIVFEKEEEGAADSADDPVPIDESED